MKIKAEEEEEETLDKNHSNANSPTIVSARAHPSAQVERALALVLLPSATESIRVEVPPKSAPTNFATLNHALPHEFSDPGAVLKEMLPNINPADPRILGL